MTRLQLLLIQRLLEALQRREMTQADLARAVGVSQKHLSQMIHGRADGSFQMWQDCFDALGFRVDVKIVRKPKAEI